MGDEVIMIPTLLAAAALLVVHCNEQAIVDCGNSGDCVDITLILDDSGSYTLEELQLQKNIVEDMVNGWTLDDNNVKLAMILFASVGKIDFDYDEYNNNKNGAKQAIQQAARVNGTTHTWIALQVAREELVGNTAKGDRPECRNTIILFTDGKSTSPRRIAEQHELLRPLFDEFFAVGWNTSANELNKTELELMASQPTEEYLFIVPFDSVSANAILPTLVTFACGPCSPPCRADQACQRTRSMCVCKPGITCVDDIEDLVQPGGTWNVEDDAVWNENTDDVIDDGIVDGVIRNDWTDDDIQIAGSIHYDDDDDDDN